MLLKLIPIFVFYLVFGDANRCSYVTVPVCDNDVTISPGSLGETGDVGSSAERAKIWTKLRELERILGSILPKSCSNATSNGRTALSTGKEAYCEDGWTVFQRRFNGRVDFYRNWTEYKNGFGDFSGEFWLGLEKIHMLTSDKQCRLRVELYDFNDDHRYAEYRSFSIGNEASNYRLQVGGYNGTAGDSLSGHNYVQFSTKDRENDGDYSINCATHFHGAWWFLNCQRSHLNGEYGESSGHAMNIIWYSWKGYEEALKATTMKLRCD